MKTVLPLIVMLVSFVASAHAATISGHIYDLDLNDVNDAVVQINSTPFQQIIAKNGTYTVEVPNGNYYLVVSQYKSGEKLGFARENISIRREGTYKLDIILFPVLEEVEDLPDIGQVDDEDKNTFYISFPFWVVIILMFIFFGAWLLLKFRKKNKNAVPHLPDPLLNELIKLLQANHNRMTQKELHKALPWSEAKLSIVLTQLEAQGKIQKFKRGRTNTVVLK